MTAATRTTISTIALTALAAIGLATPATILAQAKPTATTPRPSVAPTRPASPTRTPLARADFIRSMDAEYLRMDADKNGQLTRVEIEQAQRVVAAARAQNRKRALFTALDTDRNGQISPAEFARLPANPPRVDATPLLRFDSSRDGKVTLIEHRTATLANFDRLDVDKDGVVSPAEMNAGGIR